MVSPRELLIVPMAQRADSSQIYSGVARMAGVLWCTRARAQEGKRSDTAIIVVHPSSNFLGHYALEAWAARGVDAVAMTTRYIGNDSVLLLENCVLDIASVIRTLRAEGYERVILAGNSGGGGLACLYANQSTRATITSSPGGAGPDLTQAELPTIDALALLMAHPGRAAFFTECLDPSILDESRPFDRDPELDLFHPDRSLPLDADWVTDYRAAQRVRNERITDWVEATLSELRESTGRFDADLPMLTHAVCADPRNIDLTIDPSDRAPGTLWGPAEVANYLPTALGHYSSLQAWLSQWSLRTTNGYGPALLADTAMPVHVIYATADQACFPGMAQLLFEGIPEASKKRLTPIAGGLHYLNDQPEQTAEMARELITWVDEVL